MAPLEPDEVYVSRVHGDSASPPIYRGSVGANPTAVIGGYDERYS